MPADTGLDVDAGLVAAVRRGDADAVERLVERYGEGVYRLAMCITGTNDDAEAAAREALWSVTRRIAMFQGESSFGTWINRIATDAAYQRLLARRPSAGEVALDDVLPTLDDDGRHFGPMNDWSDRLGDAELPGELHRVLTDAIDALPADYRTALVLHDLEGISDPDIARTLGIGSAEVRSRVHRSRLFVRQRLSEHLTSA